MRIAVIGIGYADGVPRALSNKGRALLLGKRAKIIGMISMDQMAVDISNIENVMIGDKVTVIGEDGGTVVRVQDVAKLSTMSNDYEVLTGIGQRVHRIYV